MSARAWRNNACWTVVLALAIGLLGACTTSQEGGVVTGTAPATQIVSYPNGQYRLYGNGTTAAPYYWVWVPTGVTAPAPPADTSNSSVQFQGGRYQLQGNGTTSSPYYWVWVPTGTNVAATLPPPPSLPITSASVAQTSGQYQLYGNGTAASPYYWVWVPSGAYIPPPPLPPR